MRSVSSSNRNNVIVYSLPHLVFVSRWRQ